jgi:hypothetical protein
VLIYASDQRGSLDNNILLLKCIHFRIRVTPFFALLISVNKRAVSFIDMCNTIT